jgi:hypothetical protein
VKGINPGLGWYRSDPNEPTYTITVILGGKPEVESEEELKRKGLAGRRFR